MCGWFCCNDFDDRIMSEIMNGLECIWEMMFLKEILDNNESEWMWWDMKKICSKLVTLIDIFDLIRLYQKWNSLMRKIGDSDGIDGNIFGQKCIFRVWLLIKDNLVHYWLIGKLILVD